MSERNDLPMTVSDLIALLQTFPADTGVIYACCSDWSPLHPEEITLVKGVRKSHYIMRAYDNQIPTMSAENQAGVRQFVAFPGN